MTTQKTTYDPEKWRSCFPILQRRFYNRPLVYLDNAATSQTPEPVVEAIAAGYTTTKANVHRGVHTLSQEATARQEEARERVARFINAKSTKEIIFTRGTTEALNLVASSFGGTRLKAGDELILTVMEHHANIVPWQLLQRRIPFKIKVVPIHSDGTLDMGVYKSLISEKTRIVSICHASNVLGTINPISEITSIAHEKGIPVVVDGAQAVAHHKVDVQTLNVDFYTFSLHKMYGPSGIGILYGRQELLEEMPPYQGGGEMISHVSFEGTTFAELPYKFEAGTPDFIDIAAVPAAIDFIEKVGYDNIAAHEKMLLEHTTDRLINEIPGINIYGTAPDKCAVISFNINHEHNYDVGMLLDKLGIAVRTGHHCAQPLMESLGITGCARASFALYNTMAEADAFVDSLKRVTAMLG